MDTRVADRLGAQVHTPAITATGESALLTNRDEMYVAHFILEEGIGSDDGAPQASVLLEALSAEESSIAETPDSRTQYMGVGTRAIIGPIGVFQNNLATRLENRLEITTGEARELAAGLFEKFVKEPVESYKVKAESEGRAMKSLMVSRVNDPEAFEGRGFERESVNDDITVREGLKRFIDEVREQLRVVIAKVAAFLEEGETDAAFDYLNFDVRPQIGAMNRHVARKGVSPLAHIASEYADVVSDPKSSVVALDLVAPDQAKAIAEYQGLFFEQDLRGGDREVSMQRLLIRIIRDVAKATNQVVNYHEQFIAGGGKSRTVNSQGIKAAAA
jgi:hypothetical protein